jgi:hypothetical protein
VRFLFFKQIFLLMKKRFLAEALVENGGLTEVPIYPHDHPQSDDTTRPLQLTYARCSLCSVASRSDQTANAVFEQPYRCTPKERYFILRLSSPRRESFEVSRLNYALRGLMACATFWFCRSTRDRTVIYRRTVPSIFHSCSLPISAIDITHS